MKNRERGVSIYALIALSLAILVIIPLIFLGIFSYRQSKKWTEDLLLHESSSLIQTNRTLVDSLVKETERSFELLKRDPALLSIISEANDLEVEFNYFEKQKVFAAIMGKYFTANESLIGVEMVTTDYVLSWSDKLGISKDGYQESFIFRDMSITFGKTKWYSTYNSAKMYDPSSFSGGGASTQTIFTVGKKIMLNDRRGVYGIVLVHFPSSVFDKMLQKSSLSSGSVNMITDKYGNVVYESSKGFFNGNKYGLLKKAISKFSDTDAYQQEESIITFQKLDNLEWQMISASPIQETKQYFLERFKQPIFFLALILLGAALLCGMILISILNRSLKKLQTGIESTAAGDFNTIIEQGNSPREFKSAFGGFRTMNQSISNLISERNNTLLREKELELQVLNLQYNPHFLYNTLNSINLLALSQGKDEISEMITDLSSILRYSINTKEGIVTFSEDFSYIQSYVSLMRTRYDNQFDFTYNIQPEVYELRVPKFILQPLIENAILHGVQGLERKGEIKLDAAILNKEVTFVLEDNGKGMDSTNEEGENHQDMVGLSNTRNRLKLYYNNNYALGFESHLDKGTKITIRFSTEIL